MSSAYVLLPEAEGDLREIWSYIAKDDPVAADRVEEAILASCSFVADRPLAGRLRPDVTNRKARFWTLTRYPNYLIVYDATSSPIQILRILHGAMDLPRRL